MKSAIVVDAHLSMLSERLRVRGSLPVTPAGALSGTSTVAARVPRGMPTPGVAPVDTSAKRYPTTLPFSLGILTAESLIEEVRRRQLAASLRRPFLPAQRGDSYLLRRDDDTSSRTDQTGNVIPFRRFVD
jgi:hypothetical protein